MESEIMSAIEIGDPVLLETLVQGRDVNTLVASRGFGVHSLLPLSVISPKCLLWLLKHNANPNITPRYNFPALHTAVIHASTDAVRILLEYGANINLRDFSGHLPIHRIRKAKHYYDIAVLLYEYGAQHEETKDNGPITGPAWQEICARVRHCKRSVSAFTLLAKRWGVPKDLRVAIGKIAWAARRDKVCLF